VPPALTPALALDYVRELSADVRDGIVLGARGDVLAGPAHLAAAAQALLAAAGDAAEVEAATPDGVICAVRGAGCAAVVVCGRFALAGVVRQDLRVALGAVEDAPPAAVRPAAPVGGGGGVRAAADALISASQRHSAT
jgi:hypothetical protein